MDKKIIITMHGEDTLFADTQIWEEIEDELRNLILEKFGGKIQGNIESEITGNSTKIDAPRCPHCGEPVLYLENVQDVIVNWKMDKKGNYSDIPTIENSIGDINEWNCPHCGKTIAEDEEDAIAFLNSH